MRQALLNAELQSDLKGEGFSIKSLLGVGATATATVWVDPAVPLGYGVRGTTLPFQTLAEAIAAAAPGDTIIMRPGEYTWDGVITITRANVKIIGYGAIVAPANADSSDPGKILINGANGVTLEGIEFNGLANATTAPSATGCIQVNNSSDVTLKNLNIHDLAGPGILGTGRFDGISVTGCTIDQTLLGVSLQASDTSSREVEIHRCEFSHNRNGAIAVGTTAFGTVFIYELRVSHCYCLQNEATAISAAAIVINGCESPVLCDNSIYGNHTGIYAIKSTRCLITGGVIRACPEYGINLWGCQNTSVGNVLIEGKSTAGGLVGNKGIYIDNFYTVEGDSGPFLIEGVSLYNLSTQAIDCRLASSITVDACKITGTATINLAGCAKMDVSDVTFDITGNSTRILIDAWTRGWSQARIICTKFLGSGSPGRLIATTDALGNGQGTLMLIGNSSVAGQTYANGTYSNISGTAPTVIQMANAPESTAVNGSGVPLPTNGWVNDSLAAFNTYKVTASTAALGGYFVGTNKVLGARNTGWAADTGVGIKSAQATYALPTFTDPPTHTEMQNLGTAVQKVTQEVKAIKDALLAHGLLGT